jgi:hypothetical protein
VLTDGFVVSSVVWVVSPEEDRPGMDTPWVFRQSRYARAAELEKPPPGLEPNSPLGRKLAHAADALRNAVEAKPLPEPKQPPGASTRHGPPGGAGIHLMLLKIAGR